MLYELFNLNKIRNFILKNTLNNHLIYHLCYNFKTNINLLYLLLVITDTFQYSNV